MDRLRRTNQATANRLGYAGLLVLLLGRASSVEGAVAVWEVQYACEALACYEKVATWHVTKKALACHEKVWRLATWKSACLLRKSLLTHAELPWVRAENQRSPE